MNTKKPFIYNDYDKQEAVETGLSVSDIYLSITQHIAVITLPHQTIGNNTNKKFKNNVIMKNIIIYFGILIALSNVAFAKSSGNGQSFVPTNFCEINRSASYGLKSPAIASEPEAMVPSLAAYQKTMAEIIEENNRVIENASSNETFPLDFDLLPKAPCKPKSNGKASFCCKPTLKS